eukprot:CAMPEP_0116141970 /NCGR_PEP_ID=MMETSP0329-20121206/14659_1 /TAXON_ID=697910 /ORGANISM="Pseudo-nitzschia arenysensis, Strain B593" /LENGTH=334 /DNA_ID=CAMNT_0003637175 /DNA_START=116 /DNA_END=1120 /DNA_ORIENTATION=-
MLPTTNAVNTPTGKDIQILQSKCPGATPCELRRFLNAKDGDCSKAIAQLTAYLDWRDEHHLNGSYHCSKSISNDIIHEDEPTLDSSWSENAEDDSDIWHECASDEERLDELDWRFASQAALWHERNSNKDGNSNSATLTLPQLARILPQSPSDASDDGAPRDQHGHRILQFLPARMDLSKASETAFALSIALYLERKLDRDSFEKVTVAIDVRGGTGWANPRPQKLLPFIKQVAGILEQNFPERLARCLVFPVPAAATLLWRVIKVFLDPNTVQKVALIKGDSRNEAPAPYKSMEVHIGKEVLKHMEDFRCASFEQVKDSKSAKKKMQLSATVY